MSDDYDWREDAYRSWLDALRALHERAIKEGRIKPRDEADDEAWLERMKVERKGER